jgi:predicted nuclease with RNAse H fold
LNSLLQKNLISAKEASALSGYNADYLSRLCREKKIASSQVGRTWLIERASLEVFMETQLDRKIELAENLARERELEYRKANSSVTQVFEAGNDLENKMRVAASSMLGAFSSVRIPRSMPVMSGRAFAAGLTAVILGASVTLAGSGVVARAGEMLLASAFEVRALVVTAVSTSNSLAVEKTAEFSRIAEDEIKKVDTSFVRAADTRVAMLPLALGGVIENSHEPVEMTELAYARANEIFETYPEPIASTQTVEKIMYAAMHPKEVLATIAREAMFAYSRLGVYALNDIQTVLALHLYGVEAAANGLLSVSDNTRDIAG